jgi:uncharacterized Rmd1/YagE family protein
MLLTTELQVTDSREAARQRPPTLGRTGTGIVRPGQNAISVDGILQYPSDIPSAQRRGPPTATRPGHHGRTPSGRHPLDPKLAGRNVATHIPSRTSKVSEKLVILPETQQIDDDADDIEGSSPPKDSEILTGKRLKGRTYAESKPKAWRADKLPRVTAYGTAQSYKLRATADFLKSKHGGRTKLYDDSLYVIYQLPLLPGVDGYRIRSSPVMISPGGKSLLDEEIERIERRERHVGYYDDTHDFEGNSHSPSPTEMNRNLDTGYPSDHRRTSDPPQGGQASTSLSIAEMFVFSYGVVVFWNFTERQEKDILGDLTFSFHETGISLVKGQLEESDFETEEFHFEYNPKISRPRVLSDMFTLRSHDHMIKLAISHAIAQSTKLSHFEERMERTMAEAQDAPRTLALTGSLGMKREDVVKILGKLFTSRVEINLCKFIILLSGSYN